MRKGIVENILIISIALGLSLQRLSIAVGSVAWTFSIICYLIILYKYKKENKLKAIKTDYKNYYRAFYILWVVAIPAVLFSIHLEKSIVGFLDLWVYRTIPFFIVTLIANKEKLKIPLVALGVSICIDSSYAIYQAFYLDIYRPNGFGLNPLFLACLLAMIIPQLIIIICDDNFSNKKKIYAAIILIFAFLGLLAGKSRGAWLASACVVPFILGYYSKNNRKVLIGSLLCCISIMSIFMMPTQFSDRIKTTFNTTTNNSNVARLKNWESAIEMIKDYPVVGVGPKNFNEFYEKGYKKPGYELNHSHNNILQVCIEYGILTGCTYIFLTIFILYDNLKKWSVSKSPYALMIIACVLIYNIFGMFDYSLYFTTTTKTYWFMIGCMLVYRNKS